MRRNNVVLCHTYVDIFCLLTVWITFKKNYFYFSKDIKFYSIAEILQENETSEILTPKTNIQCGRAFLRNRPLS